MLGVTILAVAQSLQQQNVSGLHPCMLGLTERHRRRRDSVPSNKRNTLARCAKITKTANTKNVLIKAGSDGSRHAVMIGKARFFFTPGVPREMRRMVEEQVMPRLLKLGGGTESKPLAVADPLETALRLSPTE